MRNTFSLTACSSVVGLCILGTLGACVGDEPAVATGVTVPDGGGAETSSPGTDGGGGDSSPGTDAGVDAAPPASTGAHKFAKSYAGLYETGSIATRGESTFAAGMGGTALDLDGIPLAAASAAIVTKLDADGKATWAKSFVGTGGNPSVRPSGVSANATTAYVDGVFDTSTLVFGGDTLSRPTTYRAGFVASLQSATGTPSWARAIQTTSTNYNLTCSGIAATAAGVAVGCTIDQTTVSIGTMASSMDYTAGVVGGVNDFVVVMFDTAGAVKWANFFTGAGNDVLRALAADPSGDIVLLASVASTTIADKLTGASVGKPVAAGLQGVPFVARLGANDGKIAWSKFLGIGGATALALAVSADGKKVAVAGTMTEAVDFGIGVIAPVGAGNAGDAFVLMLDGTAHTPLWQKQIAGSGDKGAEDARGVAFDAYGQVAVVGLNRSTDTKVDGLAVPSPPQPVDTGWGSFAVKLGPGGNVLWTKGFSTQNVADAVGMSSVAFTANGELRAGGGLQGTAPLDGTTNVTAAVPYQMVLWGWQP